MRNIRSIAVLGLVSLFIAAPSNAFDWFGGRLSLGGGYGMAKPKLPYSFQEAYEEGPMWQAHMKYFINNDVSLVASYANLEPHLRGNNDNSFRFRPIVGSVRYNFIHHLPFSPYLTVGAGYSINKHEFPNAQTNHWEGFTYQGGLGLEFFVTEGASLGVEALYHHFDADDNSHPYRLVSGMGLVNLYFGPGPTQRRTQEALEREKAEAERARAEAEATRQQALASQQAAAAAQSQASAAQQQASQSAAAAAAAQTEAQKAQAQAQEAQAQLKQAQAEVDQVKQMVASKEISPITFKTGSAELEASSNETLDKVADIVKKYPNLKLRVEGHTDSVGDNDYNQQLSQKRADAVRNYLTQAGGNESQITAIGAGEGRPIASNETREGRMQNRRVEFVFTL
jgi:outer membrane protein OmpA-like peptidoglycan-associated protein/opacity protein-like surface antigen